jgi:formylglycine-generating enzyme required for sulfatase activity
MVLEKNFQTGQFFQDANWAPAMVVIPAGEFWMGSDESEPDSQACERHRHRVVIERAFALAQTPVTRQQFARFVDANGYPEWTVDDWERRSKAPMVDVSWHDAQAYTRWLSEQLGANYGLPTEGQWEYACRAGTTTAYATGDTISTTQANFSRQLHGKDSALAGHPIGYVDVGSYPANPWGLHDMHGNIWEWVQDTWHDNYADAPLTGDTAWDDGDQDYRVLRGGGWHNDAKYLRSAMRDSEYGGNHCYDTYGFRVMRTLP